MGVLKTGFSLSFVLLHTKIENLDKGTSQIKDD